MFSPCSKRVFSGISPQNICPKIQTALLYIDSYYARPINLRNMALIIDVCPDYFSRLFKKETGIWFGEGGKGKVKVATTGRVKVKVDASQNPIEAGDLLVTSDKEGVAMKSEPLELGGVPIHRPGTLIGKALEPLTSGEGEILVLLSLQ